MDQTIYSFPLTVPNRDDAPFTNERYRYLRHCAEAGATAASLRVERNDCCGLPHISVQMLRRASISRRSNGSRPSVCA